MCKNVPKSDRELEDDDILEYFPNLEEDIKRGEEESAKGLLYPLEDILAEESE